MRVFTALAVLAVLAGPALGSESGSQTTAFLNITIPIAGTISAAVRPPVATYEWEIISGAPDQVRHILLSTDAFGGSFTATLNYIRATADAPEWSSWEPYTGSWTTPPTDLGNYVFAVQGREGDVLEDDFSVLRNARYVVVANRTTGPLLTVTGMGITPIVTSVLDTPPTTIDVEGGTSVVFCWTADASAYLGVVTGYRYGFDIVDLNDPNAWEIPWTPFATQEECSPSRTFTGGTHTFTVEVMDNDGYRSRVPITMNITPGVLAKPATWGSVKARYR